MPPTKPKRRRRPRPGDYRKRKRIVHVFKDEDVVDYKDVALLRKFMSDRGKIRSRRVTGLSAKRQREVAVAIKNAREMAMLPYVSTKAAAKPRGRGRR
jgi:small subunit ribosomal protein S18